MVTLEIATSLAYKILLLLGTFAFPPKAQGSWNLAIECVAQGPASLALPKGFL